MIKALGFDFSGVCFTYNSEKFMGDLSKELGVPKELVKKAWSAKLPYFEKGELDETTFFEYLLNEVGKRHDHKALHQIAIEQFKPVPEVLAVIAKLRENYRVGLMTNQTWMDELEQKYHLKKDFDFVIVSKEVKCRKPEPEIFELLIQKSECRPNEIIFVDDSIEYKTATETAGINFVHYKDIDQLKEDLQRFGINIDTTIKHHPKK